MPDQTLRITREPDFFPLVAGLRLRYRHTSTEFDGVETVDISLTQVDAFRDDAVAHAVLTRTRMGGETKVHSYQIRKTAKEVAAGGGVLGWARREFPLPAVPGKQWTERADRHELASLEGEIQVPAGRFLRCLRVNTFIAGGDGGSAIRYYAPGIGYVYEEYSGETWGARVELTEFKVP